MSDGLDLRDRFAAAALPTVLQVASSGGLNPRADETNGEAVARCCYEYADAMIAERNRGINHAS